MGREDRGVEDDPIAPISESVQAVIKMFNSVMGLVRKL